MKPRVAVIGFAAQHLVSPRGERVNVLASELSTVADVELVTGAGGKPERAQAASRTRHWTGQVARTFFLDRHELESARTLLRWPASVDAALLIGWPFSPLVWASRRLARREVPYVVDVGDPWVLTAPRSPTPSLASLRGRRCERFMWENAAGGIATTDLQAKALRQHFPSLPILVRPNGFIAVDSTAAPRARRSGRPSELRIVHYGSLYPSRLDVAAFLSAVAAGGIWNRIRFTLYGTDWPAMLRRLHSDIAVEVRDPRPWSDIVAMAGEHDVALVVGWRNPAQLPSKAVQYLTLPIPRVALVSGKQSDALQAYVSDKLGWLTIGAGEDPSRWVPRLAAHAERSWTRGELRPPASEAWSAVAERIVAFVSACTSLPLSRGHA